MSPDLSLLPWIITGVSIISLFIISRQKQNAQHLVRDMHKRLEAGRDGYEVLSQEHNQMVRNWQEARQMVQDSETAIRDLKNRLAKRERDQDKSLADLRDALNSANRRIEHLTEESKTLHVQLTEADVAAKAAVTEERERTNFVAQKRFDELKQKYDETKGAFDKLSEEHKTLKHSFEEQMARMEKLSAILRQVNPEEHQRTRRKAKQMEQLYTSMKSLKELADERIKNWEVALMHLSSHVLERPFDPKAPIGATVGAALEKIGARLVDDDEGEPQHVKIPDAAQPLGPHEASLL